MWIKTAGVLFIVLGTSCLGISYGSGLKKRIRLLDMIERMMILLRGEIRYGATPLPEALDHMAGKLDMPLSGFLASVVSDLNAMDGKNFQELWEENAKNHIGKNLLSQEELTDFIKMGRTLGYLDKEMQLGSIDFYMEQLKLDRVSLEKTYPEKRKLYCTMGVLLGMMISILLV